MDVFSGICHTLYTHRREAVGLYLLTVGLGRRTGRSRGVDDSLSPQHHHISTPFYK